MRERPYEFRRRLEQVHKPNRRDPGRAPQTGETEVTADWSVLIGGQAGPTIVHTAKDLQDYFFTSMGFSVKIVRLDGLSNGSLPNKAIILCTKEEWPEIGQQVARPGSFRLLVEPERIVVCGYDARGASQGSFYVEDVMNLCEAPLLGRQDTVREPLFSPRMIHSGWGLDQYPDSHLNALAHAGFDSILLFVKDVNKTAHSYLDFNYLIDRASLYGLDVYAYSYLISRKHPDEPGAEAYYDGTYGKVFEACPRLKGVILVGESCEFPSKDPNTTGILREEWPKSRVQTKPSPGWWPCVDYPEWLDLLQKVVRKHNADADIVFWTYNWGYAPEAERLRLIRELPEQITLLVTFEMFEQLPKEHTVSVCPDYTISFEGPGRYFSSEAQAAAERGLKLYTMSNTGGLTWDFGVIPYEPVPFQWARRYGALLRAREQWGLSGLMESHHYGWWPSFVSELAKWAFWSPGRPERELGEAIARRDFCQAAVPYVLQAWEHWSEAIRDYVPTSEDQYGPFRVGPSYPLVFASFPEAIKMPEDEQAIFGNLIVITDYAPIDGPRWSPGSVRVDAEIRSLERMAFRWQQGNDCLAEAMERTPESKLADARYMLGLNRFIVHTVQTAIHVKKWWKLKQRLFGEADARQAEHVLDDMVELAHREIANAAAAIPYVEADSRLGWEPTMEYMTDPGRIRWKIAQTRAMLESSVAEYRQALALIISNDS